MGAVSFSSF